MCRGTLDNAMATLHLPPTKLALSTNCIAGVLRDDGMLAWRAASGVVQLRALQLAPSGGVSAACAPATALEAVATHAAWGPGSSSSLLAYAHASGGVSVLRGGAVGAVLKRAAGEGPRHAVRSLAWRPSSASAAVLAVCTPSAVRLYAPLDRAAPFRVLESGAHVTFRGCAWSADGSRLAILTNGDLRTVAVEDDAADAAAPPRVTGVRTCIVGDGDAGTSSRASRVLEFTAATAVGGARFAVGCVRPVSFAASKIEAATAPTTGVLASLKALPRNAVTEQLQLASGKKCPVQGLLRIYSERRSESESGTEGRSLGIDAATTTSGECSFVYRYILRESCSQFDSLPLTSLTPRRRRQRAPTSWRTRRRSTWWPSRAH